MAKCGCSGGNGGVLILAGARVTVEGIGTPERPYVISSQGSSVAVLDSDTVELTLTGTGEPTDPYTLQADYIGELPVPDQQPSVFQNWSGAVNLSSIAQPTTIRATLNGNVTSVTLPTWPSTTSGSITFALSQDATGGRTWVMPGTSAGGTDIVLSTAANARDIVRAFWTGAQWVLSAVALNVS